MPDIPRDLTRTTLAIICIVGLIGLSLWVMRPFLAATVWATMLVVATWPLLLSLQARLGQRRLPAVMIMTLGMLLLLVAPFWLAIDTISDHAESLTALIHAWASGGLPPPPAWLAALPLIGERLAAGWTQLAAAGTPGLLAKVTPYAAETGKWVLAQAGGLGGMLVQFLLVLTIAAILFTKGEAAALLVRRLGRRLAGGWPVSAAKTRSSWPARQFVAWRWASVSPPSCKRSLAASVWPWSAFLSLPSCPH